MIGVAPSAYFEAAADPAEIFVVGGRARSGQRSASSGADSAGLRRSGGAFRVYRFFCHLQNLGGDNRFVDRLLLHPVFTIAHSGGKSVTA